MYLIKKILIYTVIFILLIGLLACRNNPDIKGLKNDRWGIADSIEPEIIVESPMTISTNELISREDQIYYLRLKMINGKYYENWNWGEYMGTIWEGEYELEIVDEFGEVKNRIDLNKVFKESTLIFTSSFEIEFDDYNNDGDIDFTIGQFASSNIREYKLFTIRNHEKIELLPIENNSSLYIGTTTGYYSTKLTKLDEISFKIEFYNNTDAVNVEEVYRWEEGEFIKLDF